MKRMYVTPEVEKIEFQFRNQVVVASYNPCEKYVAATYHAGVNAEETHECALDDPNRYTVHVHDKEWPECTNK